MKKLRICLLEPWYGGSHRRWADGLQQHSRHAVDILSLPARHWKWRMHGAAVSLARKLIDNGRAYDLLLANDMMDVAVFTALIRQAGMRTPVAVYFHENQISYPVSPRDTDIVEGRDLHYGFINYTSALVADCVYFNSHYHRESFLSALPGFLGSFPDPVDKVSVEATAAKSEVLPLGMDLQALESHRPAQAEEKRVPLILWNHRWEYDKCPGEFIQLLLALHRRGLAFEVALLGERGGEEPHSLAELRRALGPAIVQDGPVEAFADYARWLWRADILPVTGIQDFFGGSVVEAIYAGCHPVLPRRLAYPEHLDAPAAFYDSPAEAVELMVDLIASGRWRRPFQSATAVRRYDWAQLAPRYDAVLAQSAESGCQDG